jgi:hypothetical protein
MTAINFPDTPEVGDTFTVGLITWVWNGTVWKGTSSPVPGPEGPAGDDGLPGEANFSSFLLMGS